MSWKRAVQPEQKDQRRDALLGAARTLYDSGSDGSLRKIAKAAGIAPSGVYRYFSSREAILLAILGEDVTAWMKDICDALDELPDGSNVASIAEVMTACTVDRARLLRLLGQRAQLLEGSATASEVAEFRLCTLGAAERAESTFRRLLPEVGSDALRMALLHLFSIISATPHLRFPSETAIEAMRHPALAASAIAYPEYLKGAVEMVLQGAQAMSRPK